MPGWPLPTFWTASIARTRAVSTRLVVEFVPVERGGSEDFSVNAVPLGGVRPRAGARAGVQDHRCVRWPRLRAYRRGRVDSTPPRRPDAGSCAPHPPRFPEVGIASVQSAPSCHRGPHRVHAGRTHHPRGRRPVTSAADGPPTFKDVVAAYVGLTKPRVIELLLLTTVPVMFFAARGVPALGLGRGDRRRWRASRRAPRRSTTASTTATSTSRCAAPGAVRCRGTSCPRALGPGLRAVLGVLSTVILWRCGSTRSARGSR